MDKPWNDSDLAQLSADLDDELTAIFDKVEASLNPNNDQGSNSERAEMPGSIIRSGLIGGAAGLDLSLPPANAQAEAETDWLEPGLLGEPELSIGLTPEAIRELSRIIEAAVEKGVLAALAKMKG